MRAESSLNEAKGQPLPAGQGLTPQDLLGCTVGHLQRDQELSANGVRIYRKTVNAHERHYVETAASGRGVLLGISLRDGHRRRILHEHHASCHDFSKGSIYVRDFCDRYRADMQSGFDFVLLEISHPALERAIDEKRGPRVGGLVEVAGVRDEVLAHLASALTPALERPAEVSLLFVDQLSVAMTSYLVDNYGRAATATEPPANRLLSRSHEARVKEMLRSKMDGNISIAEIAGACNLSRSYFIRAFRETTGQTPHQWLTAQRLERARALLKDVERPLADVAAACGFADQSHFTRVFSQHTGMPPGGWRKKMQLEK